MGDAPGRQGGRQDETGRRVEEASARKRRPGTGRAGSGVADIGCASRSAADGITESCLPASGYGRKPRDIGAEERGGPGTVRPATRKVPPFALRPVASGGSPRSTAAGAGLSRCPGHRQMGAGTTGRIGSPQRGESPAGCPRARLRAEGRSRRAAASGHPCPAGRRRAGEAGRGAVLRAAALRAGARPSRLPPPARRGAPARRSPASAAAARAASGRADRRCRAR